MKRTFVDSLFLGAALASSSTVIIARILTGMKKLKDISALLMLGISVTEDLVVVFILTAFTTAFGVSPESNVEILWTLGKAAIFLACAFLIGIFLIRKL